MYFFQNENEEQGQWEFPASNADKNHILPNSPPIPNAARTPEKPPLPLSPPPSEITPPLPSLTLPVPPPPPLPDSTSAGNSVDFGTDMDIEPVSNNQQMETNQQILYQEKEQIAPYSSQPSSQNVTSTLFSSSTSLINEENVNESPTVTSKKRKKIKLKEGLALKKKHMSSLVEKWVKIKEETGS